jgi:hypothetical protein
VLRYFVQCSNKCKGILYVTTTSLVIEEFNIESPLVQFYFQQMFKAPCQDPDFPDTIIFSTWGRRFLPDFANFETAFTETTEKLEEIAFLPLYDSPSKVAESIQSWYSRAKQLNWQVKEQEVFEALKLKNKFDYNQIASVHEKYLIREAVYATRVFPCERRPGWLFVTDVRLYFQSLTPINDLVLTQIPNKTVELILKRKWTLRSIGIEVFTEKKSCFFTFSSEKARDEIFSAISSSVQLRTESEKNLEEMTTKWQQRQVSNYDYLLYLNKIANRSFCDLSQYPVFPWVLKNFTSATLDLSNPMNFRDLSKPIGALTPERLHILRQKLKEIPEPKFLYDKHYSNPAIIIRWLVRSKPLFSLRLQVRAL